MRVLVVDVGMGTSDILLHDDSRRGENQTHLVVPSATRVVAAEIRAATRRGLPVVLRGRLMGGGPSTSAMDAHIAEGLAFYAEPDAARTFSDDLSEVASMGVSLVGEDEAESLAAGGAAVVRSGDVRLDDLTRALALLGETEPLDGLGVAVQDHGEAPAGVSDRVFRFERLVESLESSRRLTDLFYVLGSIPAHFTRLEAAGRCMAAGLGESPALGLGDTVPVVVGDTVPVVVGDTVPVVVGDTGPAALLGAALSRGAPCVVINYGNGHTLMAVVRDGEIDGLFEHHTGRLDRTSMAAYVTEFLAGRLESAQVLADGGHGVLPVSAAVEPGSLDVLVTGPNRARFAGVTEREVETSIHGSMMITGCYGLLEGFRARVP